MHIEFIATFAVVTPDVSASRALYVEALGLPLTHADGDDYLHSGDIEGSKHFGVWPLAQAAQACFGTAEWPAGTPVPQASVEFECAGPDAVQDAADELRGRGYALLHDARVEPWGQIVARLLSPENVIVGLSYVPSFHTSPTTGQS
jgi:catechol 2,3-dioxygenase-like lactoylglutathione lyase family enzyme